jgi:hypothetical protein
MPLPIINNISFSGASSFYFCPHFYKLTEIDRMKKDGATVYTAWGTLLHSYVQGVLLGKFTKEDAVKKLTRTWKKFCGLYKQKEVEGWCIPASKALLEIKDILEKKFGTFKVVSVEEKLVEHIRDEYTQKFKGFIDLVLELNDGSLVIIDIKSCASHFMFFKFKETFKDYQLTLYKYFFKQKKNTTVKIETYFTTVERNPSSKKPVELTRITSGTVKIKNALKWIDNALFSINSGKFPKNRMSCHKYTGVEQNLEKTCIFLNSPHCTSTNSR